MFHSHSTVPPPSSAFPTPQNSGEAYHLLALHWHWGLVTGALTAGGRSVLWHLCDTNVASKVLSSALGHIELGPKSLKSSDPQVKKKPKCSTKG